MSVNIAIAHVNVKQKYCLSYLVRVLRSLLPVVSFGLVCVIHLIFFCLIRNSLHYNLVGIIQALMVFGSSHLIAVWYLTNYCSMSLVFTIISHNLTI